MVLGPFFPSFSRLLKSEGVTEGGQKEQMVPTETSGTPNPILQTNTKPCICTVSTIYLHAKHGTKYSPCIILLSFKKEQQATDRVDVFSV